MPKESAYFQLKNVDGQHSTKNIKKSLSTFNGINSVSVNREKNTVAVDFDSSGVCEKQLSDKLREMGCEILQEHSERYIF